MFSDPQFWVAVAFIAFVGAIFNPVRKILKTNLDSQIQEIKNKIEEAENLKNETQITLSEIKKRQNDVQNEIKLINEEAQKKIKQIEENTEIKLQEQINKRKVLAEAKINQLTRDANNIIQKHISSTAIAAAVSILNKKLNNAEKQNLIDQSIKEIGQTLKN